MVRNAIDPQPPVLDVRAADIRPSRSSAQMPSAEEGSKQSSDEPDSDSKFEVEPTEEENQNDTSSIEMEEEVQSSAGKFRSKPAYLSSNPESQKPSLFAIISDSWFRSQKIRYSHIEKSDFCNTMMREMLLDPQIFLHNVWQAH
ncbi:adipogenin [Amazona aestiva]|uniref:Adipogenin n=1 Tax=Amazona aestiva TaxID=12930 RepID=A0A0Q3P331_AMAAE|nr:adipogenin [Amazona aestiva]